MTRKIKTALTDISVIGICVIVLLTGFFFANSGKSTLSDTDRASETFAKAKVIQIGEVVNHTDIPDSVTDMDIHFRCKVLSGEYKGEEIAAIQNISTYLGQEHKKIEPGDRIMITLVDDTTESGTWYFAEYIRSEGLTVLLLIFFAALIAFGKMRGFKTIISLVLTVSSVFMMLIPAIFTGKNIYVWSVVVCLYIIGMTLCIVNGLKPISLAAGLGCVAGVAFSSVMIIAFDRIMGLTGFVDETSIYLSYIDMNGKTDLRGLVFAAVTIGSVGAIMDVAVDISASLHEIALKVKKPTFGELVESGFTIGRDVIGTMSNTLILAYIGSSLGFVLLVIYNSSDSLLYIFNRENIVVELLKMLIGSLGILMTLPLTSFICGYLYTHPCFTCSNDISDDNETDEGTEELMRLSRSLKLKSKDEDSNPS